MEPWISGVTAVEGIKILRPHNIGAYAKVGQGHPKGPARTILSYLSPSLHALRTAVRSIIKSTSLSRYPNGTVFICVVGWSFSTWSIARKTILYKIGPFT